jgi:hypothetical protein
LCQRPTVVLAECRQMAYHWPVLTGRMFRADMFRKKQEELMSGRIATLMGTLIVGAVLVLSAVSFAQAPSAELQRQRRNNFPVMHGVIQLLQQAKSDLQHDAANDFEGHKANAVKHIDSAIQELKLGIQADRAPKK